MIHPFTRKAAVPAIALAFWSCAGVQAPETQPATPLAERPLEDPLEPANRATWQLNRALVLGVLDPLSAAYVSLVPGSVRKSVGNVRKNLGGPARVVNQVLQGRWEDSGRESVRFLTNSTIGIGGAFDVAGKMDLPGSKADFNQTFRHWGMRPTTYLVLPALGPSDEVHALASLFDIAADPSNYIADLAAVGHATRFDRLSEIAPSAAAMFRSEADSYSLGKQAGPYLARTTPPDWTLEVPPDPATLDSLNAALARLQDPLFVHHSRTGKARISATGEHLPYSLWMQDKPAPIVYLAPGVGSHRLSSNTLVLAEAIHRMGFSVATISGVFHPEFMEHASTAPMPGNPVWDRADMLAAWTAVDASIQRKFPDRVTRRTLAGFSLGGFMAMQLAGTEDRHAAGSVQFDRYVAIQTPVDLPHAYTTLDDYADVPNRWPEDEREQRIDKVFHKAVAIFDGGPPSGVAPFDANESKFLVGYSFRRVLRDAIFSLQQRGLCDGLCDEGSTWRREPIYDQLMDIRFDEYHHDWLRPAEKQRGISEVSLDQATDLQHLGSALRRHSDVRIIENRNDFLLSAADRKWLDRTFGDRITWLPGGGHLGNLSDPALRQALARALDAGK
ncbi:MAG TPA: MlaA family lipoprotein [Luteolibacter sp.]|nr:MlaA family lipoprotein [Luteolibacter sp.]